MAKKRGFTLAIVILLITLPSTYFLLDLNSSNIAISGMAIRDLTSKVRGVSLSVIIFALQWIILAIIAIIIYIRFVKNKKKEKRKLNISPEKKERKLYSETDLDTLYKLLKEKESLSTGTIGKIFQIPKDKALEWAKILENNKLVTIEYPAFSDPEIIIKTKAIKGEKGEKFVVDFFSIKQEGEKEEKGLKKKVNQIKGEKVPTKNVKRIVKKLPKKHLKKKITKKKIIKKKAIKKKITKKTKR